MKLFTLFTIVVEEGFYKDFARLYEAWFPLLYRIVLRITGRQDISEEVVQEAFIKYYERQHLLPHDEGIKYWLIRVVRNLALNYEKRRGREKKAMEKVFHESRPDVAPDGEKNVVQAETVQEVQEALMKIPYNLRVVLVLKEYGGFSYSEIGKMMNITEGNVKVRVFRARSQLAQILGKEES